jgi:hypothetical protein
VVRTNLGSVVLWCFLSLQKWNEKVKKGISAGWDEIQTQKTASGISEERS